MSRPRVIFVDHTSKIAGAELVLLDVVRSCRGASAFLFEDGPLDAALRQRGLDVIRSRFGGGLAKVRRDESLWSAAPLIGKLGAITTEIGVAARRHDVVHANRRAVPGGRDGFHCRRWPARPRPNRTQWSRPRSRKQISRSIANGART